MNVTIAFFPVQGPVSQQAGGALDRHRRGQGSNIHLVLSRCCLSSAKKCDDQIHSVLLSSVSFEIR